MTPAPDPLHAVFVDWQGPGRVESGHCITAGGAYEALTPENRLVTVWRAHQRIFASEPA